MVKLDSNLENREHRLIDASFAQIDVGAAAARFETDAAPTCTAFVFTCSRTKCPRKSCSGNRVWRAHRKRGTKTRRRTIPFPSPALSQLQQSLFFSVSSFIYPFFVFFFPALHLNRCVMQFMSDSITLSHCAPAQRGKKRKNLFNSCTSRSRIASPPFD